MRLFVGLALPSGARQRLAGLESGLPGARWVPPENLHISLRFIGEVDSIQAEDIGHGLSEIKVPAFEVKLDGVGCFESRRKVRVLWAGVEHSEALVHLYEKVESAVVRAGFEPEGRKFKPHVTLARFKNGHAGKIGHFIEVHNGFQAEPFTVDRLTLFQSHLTRAGAGYQELAEYPLEEIP